MQSELPALNDPTGGLLIDGATATGSVPGDEPVMVLDGSLAGRYTAGLVVAAGSDGNEIRGLRIQSFGGGGVHNSGTLAVIDLTITGNLLTTYSYGGGIYCGKGTTTVTNSRIFGNYAGDGGGIYVDGGTVSVTNSVIAENSVQWDGGGIRNWLGTLTVTNSVIAENSAGKYGGGIHTYAGVLAATNSTIAGNMAGEGGGIYSGIYEDSGIATLMNSIVAENTAAVDTDVFGPLAEGSDYNLIGVWSDDSTLPGQHNLSGTPEARLDPRLSHWTDMGGGIWGCLLLPDSPALDAGSNALAVDPEGLPLATDVYGNPRILGDTVGIGAVEGATEPGPAVTCVVESLDDSIAQDGILTFREAFQAANTDQGVGDAPPGSFAHQDRIEFAPGISGSFLLGGRALTVYGDLAIEGPGAGELTFDAQDASRIFEIRTRAKVALSGMTITRGYAGGGGGVHNFGTLALVNSTVAGNSASGSGGIYNRGTLALANSTVAGNSADYRGGGITNSWGTLTVTNSTIVGNSTNGASPGGGIYNWFGSVTLTNSILARNAASTHPDMEGSLADGSDWNLIGVWSDDSALPGEHNLSGTREAPLDPGLSHWTDLGGGSWGYRLLPESPALGAGNNALAVDPEGLPLATDLYGNPRIQDGTVDLGAVEGATEPTEAVSYLVETLDDSIADDGIVTFGEAFRAADSNQAVGDAPAGSFAGQDRIEFAPDVWGTLLRDARPLRIHGDLAIEGPPTQRLTFDAQGAGSVFEIRPGVRAAIGGVDITGGNEFAGGGINNYGTLELADSSVTGNLAQRYAGGIQNIGELTVSDSNIEDNGVGRGAGGGIYTHGALTVNRSTIAGNSASVGGGTLAINRSTIAGNSASRGAGVYAVEAAVTVDSSTIAENAAGEWGGGMYHSYGSLTVINSTIAENSAQSRGGGIYQSDGTLTIADSTIANNTAGGEGGGVFTRSRELTITNSAVTGNSAVKGGGIRAYGGVFTNVTITGNRADYGGGVWA